MMSRQCRSTFTSYIAGTKIRKKPYDQRFANVKGTSHVTDDQETISGNRERCRIVASANKLRSNRCELRSVRYAELNCVGRSAICGSRIRDLDVI